MFCIGWENTYITDFREMYPARSAHSGLVSNAADANTFTVHCCGIISMSASRCDTHGVMPMRNIVEQQSH